jgi:hypothetical protein
MTFQEAAIQNRTQADRIVHCPGRDLSDSMQTRPLGNSLNCWGENVEFSESFVRISSLRQRGLITFPVIYDFLGARILQAMGKRKEPRHNESR